MRFFKMHGTGNDFVLLENLKDQPMDYPSLARTFCAPHTGIGADGILVVLPSKRADFRMRIFNSDGSEAEMCGNGIRCFARHVFEKGLTSKKKFTLETGAGIMEPECFVSDGKVEKVRVNMGIPRYGDLHPAAGRPLSLNAENLNHKIEFQGGMVEGATVSMGNPHFVIFTAGTRWNMEEHGKHLSVHKIHPHQSNVEFVEILEPEQIRPHPGTPYRIRVKVWERGVGPTQACGSGACASVAAGRILKGMPENVVVEMPGGPLEVEWNGQDSIYLTGPASYVFEGEASEELLGKVPTASGKN